MNMFSSLVHMLLFKKHKQPHLLFNTFIIDCILPVSSIHLSILAHFLMYLQTTTLQFKFTFPLILFCSLKTGPCLITLNLYNTQISNKCMSTWFIIASEISSSSEINVPVSIYCTSGLLVGVGGGAKCKMASTCTLQT